MNHLRKFFQDKEGKVVIAQFPNFPLVGWFVCKLISMFETSDSVRAGFSTLGGAFLFLWAYLEITTGVSYFRRFLGVVVMLFSIYSMFRWQFIELRRNLYLPAIICSQFNTVRNAKNHY